MTERATYRDAMLLKNRGIERAKGKDIDKRENANKDIETNLI